MLPAADLPEAAFFKANCYECHDADVHKAGLDLTKLTWDVKNADNQALWVKIHDRIRDGEMPPAKKPRPDAKESAALTAGLAKRLIAADSAEHQAQGRTPMRRLSRTEFEWSVRDLLAMPAISLKDSLPEDGRYHGFDRLAHALDFSSIHLEAYLTAVDKALDAALCPLTGQPPTMKFRYRLWDQTRHEGKEAEGWVGRSINERIAIGLIGMQQDVDTFKAATPYTVQDTEPFVTALGMFRQEDADYRCSLDTIKSFYTGWYKLRASGYSFHWDGKQVQPTERGGALSWGIYSKNIHYGTVGLPPNKAGETEITAWIERGGGMTHGTDDNLRIVLSSCENVRDFAREGDGLRGPKVPTPGIAVEWVEIEGPIIDQWPPASHRVLFGNLPVKEWTKEVNVPLPKQQTWPNGNPWSFPRDPYGERGDKRQKVYVASEAPLADAEKLLLTFARRAFRRPVSPGDVSSYLTIVKGRLDAGAAFQDAMLAAYRGILTAPEFLLLRESPGKLSAHALAARLSAFLWSSVPDEALLAAADTGALAKSDVLRAQTERLLADAKGQRFITDFLAQWLSLREINATQPDKKLYPEFTPLLQEAMLLESHAFFAELVKGDLAITNLVKSDFAMLNEPLARHYGISGVQGWDMRKVPLPKDSRRGGVLTQAAVLKVTAAGTTTSPVKRGAFVMERILGIHPSPPPADAGAIEPDVRGATTVREQLEKHRRNDTCSACHQKMDGYGFALESFDVTGEWRAKYRAVGGGKGPEKDKIVNGHHIQYHFELPVDCSGTMPDGRPFADIDQLRDLLVSEPEKLARAFVGNLVTYATGEPVSFADRAVVDAIVAKAKATGYGIRTLIHETIQSDLFRTK
jgi:cytochrome c551/c552